MRYFLIAELIKNLLPHTHSLTRTHKHTHINTCNHILGHAKPRTNLLVTLCTWTTKSMQTCF